MATKSYSEDPTTIAVSRALRQKRFESGMTWADLEAATGINKRSLERYLRGERDMPISALVPICEAFDITPADLWATALPANNPADA